jgi:hypothetical protein
MEFFFFLDELFVDARLDELECDCKLDVNMDGVVLLLVLFGGNL